MIRHSLINRENWDKIAVIDNGRYLSYHWLAQKAIAIRNRLPAITQSRNIVIFLPDSADYIAALWGIIMAGRTAFPLNIKLTIHEIAPLLIQASVGAVITSEEYRPLFEKIIKDTPVQTIYIDSLPAAKDCESLSADNIDPNETMLLLATSGTTGKAKIVQLSEKNVETSTLAYIDKMDFEKFPADEIRLTPVTPFSSIYGLMVLTACVIKSIPIVVIKGAITLDTIYKAAEKYKITHFEGGVSIGLLMAQMAGRPISYDISSLRYFGLAGSKLPADILKRLIDSYPGVEFWPGYGMTEAGPLIAKPYKKVNIDKLDSVGTKIDPVTIMVDVGGTLTDAPGRVGEIVVKGPNVMKGYYKNEEETGKILKDGWLYTGDVGYLDEDGYLYICGRKKNMIIVRGFNVYAEEVEACILNSGLAGDCFVYGVTDRSGGETVHADIIPIDVGVAEKDIRAYCESHLAEYKRPRVIKMIAEIKKTATGKTERV